MLTSLHLHMKSSEVCIKTRSPPASLPIQGQVTKHTTVKWPIVSIYRPCFGLLFTLFDLELFLLNYSQHLQIEEESREENSVVAESSPLIHLIDSDEHERSGTVFSSIFTLVSTMVGGGILSLPFAFQQGGFILTSVVLLCVLMASTHGAFLIINSKRYCQGKIRNVEDVANIAFGNKGKVCNLSVTLCSVNKCLVCQLIRVDN